LTTLHRSIWFTYRRALGGDASLDAHVAFRRRSTSFSITRPALDAASACREVGRMVMMRPRGVANRGRVVAPAALFPAAASPTAAKRARPRVRRALSAAGEVPGRRCKRLTNPCRMRIGCAA